MTSRPDMHCVKIENAADFQVGQLKDKRYFQAWKEDRAAQIQANDEKNQRGVLDAVIRAIEARVDAGIALEDAMDMVDAHFPHGFRGGVNFTPKTVRRALKVLGWKKNGGVA